MSERPYWKRELREGTIALILTADQASALARELRELRELRCLPFRLDELHHRLTFDADYLRLKAKHADEDRSLVVLNAADVTPKPPPTCEVCGKGMWWHGSTIGWGCPKEADKRGCLSQWHRPKPKGQEDRVWSYRDRYPEHGEAS